MVRTIILANCWRMTGSAGSEVAVLVALDDLAFSHALDGRVVRVIGGHIGEARGLGAANRVEEAVLLYQAMAEPSTSGST